MCTAAGGLLLAAVAQAQQPGPALHHRSAAQGGSQPLALATGHINLPSTAEGEYPWGKSGAEIELYFDGGKLHGYMTEPSNPQDARSTPITFDFATTRANGHAVAWTTRQVHGVSWSFQGHLERGLVASPMQSGYYLLTGTLTQHDGGAVGASRLVSLKREPGND